jgi:hypothetical protein
MDEEGMEMLNGLFESLSEEMLNTDGNKTDDEAESENEDI